ncbi:RhoGEF-domain-containing protein [Backusella circina FSU 941]|nr:RhoGEF-domain-containing protein [Backusella circina FSU 941]
MTTLALSRRSPSVVALDTPLSSPPGLKPANTQQNTGSLYHTCRFVLDRLAVVEGMTECIDSVMLEEEKQQFMDINNRDPLTKLTLICRRGFPLCKLYNALNPNKPLSEDRVPKLTMTNSCKANVYHFIVACRDQLLFPEDDMFTISDLYQDDTNGFVKVVNTVSKLLQLLEDRGIIAARSANRNSDPNAPRNTRDKVVLELLETERRYVHDMEILQNYMRELQNQKIVSPDTIHYLFGNLNALVDFQRRFLINLEEIAERPAQEQRVGNLFVQMEGSFSVYEPYCANYYSAQDLVVQETPKLLKLADVMNPVYQLQSLLIKPVQRICKYPLLLHELVKSTDPNWEYFQEAQDGLDAIKRVAEKVNETQRQHENLQIVEDLKKRLNESSSATSIVTMELQDFGNLVIQDKLLVVTVMNDTDKELSVFCFENMLLFCKESKGSTILPKSNTLSINKKKRRGSLVPKFSVPINNICDMNTFITKDGSLWCLVLDVNHKDLNQVTIKFRNEEQLKLWHVNLTKLKKAAYDSSLRVSNTNHSSGSSSSSSSSIGTQPGVETANGFYNNDDDKEVDDSDEDDEDDIYIISRSRSGSLASQKQYHQQQQQQQQQQQMAAHIKLSPSKSTDSGWKISTGGRPYQNVPGMNLSPLPRAGSHSTQANMTPIQYGYYPASPPPSYPSSPTTSSSRVSSTSSSTTWYYHQRHDPNALADITGKFLVNGRPDEYVSPPPLIGRTQSHSAAMDSSVKINTSHPMVQSPHYQQQQNRLRSQSSPNIMGNINAHHQSDVNSMANSVPNMPPLMVSRVQKIVPIDLSQEQQQQSAQHHLVANSQPLDTTTQGENTVKLKLNFNDCVYVVVANQIISYFELVEKVQRKIRLVADLRSNDLLRLKYQDEDGDFITINSDDDVQMAFESRGVHNTVNLFVSH